MKRFDSPKLRINQTHYPEQSLSKDRMPAAAYREDSLDHEKYKPILRQSSSRLKTPPVVSRNNLFEAALKKNTTNLRVTLSDTTRALQPALTHNIRSLANNPELENIARPEPPKIIREIVEKNALFDRRGEAPLARRLGLPTSPHNLTEGKTVSNNTVAQEPQRQGSPLLSPSSSSLYKPFFPGVRSPKLSQGGSLLRTSSNNFGPGKDSPRNTIIGPADARSIEANSRNFDVLSHTEFDQNDLEAVKDENRLLKDRIRQMEQDQELILQLNHLLLQKLAQFEQQYTDHTRTPPVSF